MCSAFPTCKGEAQGKWGKYLQHWRKCCCFLNTCSSVLSPSRGQYRMALDNKHLPSKQHCSQPLLHSCIIHKLLCELQHAGKVLALCTKSSEHHFFFSWCAHKHIATSCMLFPVAEERQGQLFIRHRAHKRHTHTRSSENSSSAEGPQSFLVVGHVRILPWRGWQTLFLVLFLEMR